MIIEILKISCYTAPGLLFLIAGIYHKTHLPGFEKGFGYKSTNSILSKKTWTRAQLSIANWSIRLSLGVLLVSFALYCFANLSLLQEMIFGGLSFLAIPLISKWITDSMLKEMVQKGLIHD